MTLAVNSYSAGNGGSTQGTLACTSTLTVAAVNGVATFSGCQVTGSAAAGTYTLNAIRTGLTTGASGNVVINVGSPSQFVFTSVPGGDQTASATATIGPYQVSEAGGAHAGLGVTDSEGF